MRYAIHTLLARTAHAQRNYLRPYLKEMGLSPGQPKVLRYLSERDHSSQRELADYCDVDPSAICWTAWSGGALSPAAPPPPTGAAARWR